tara:strand:- start:330 stop:515 length:186 start_codon:yes stop_codon:yes gene_type:complete
MVNFWISVITVIVFLGLVNAGMQDHQVSRIGSRDAEIRTQGQDANLPTEPLLPSQAAPDEQ